MKGDNGGSAQGPSEGSAQTVLTFDIAVADAPRSGDKRAAQPGKSTTRRTKRKRDAYTLWLETQLKGLTTGLNGGGDGPSISSGATRDRRPIRAGSEGSGSVKQRRQRTKQIKEYAQPEGEARGQKPLSLILREHENTLRKFLEHTTETSLSDFSRLCAKVRSDATRELKANGVGPRHARTAVEFLDAVQREVLLEKIKTVLIRYLESGTDYHLVSGRLWAARSQVVDYMEFLFEEFDELGRLHPQILASPAFKNTLGNLRHQLAVAAAAFSD